MNELNVLSVCDGISVGKAALDRANIKVDTYFASEIKPIAIQVSKNNHTDIIQIGDIKNVHFYNGVLITEKRMFDVGKIDLLMGGTPCQDFSNLKYLNWEVNGLDGDKSCLFYEYLRLLKEINPKYFLLENVAMKKQHKEELDDFLNVPGMFINSRLVSYQNRPRLYWFNWKVGQPQDKHINFQDYKSTDYEYCKQFKVNDTPSRRKMWGEGKGRAIKKACDNITYSDKVFCLTRKQDRFPNSGLIEFDDFCRYLTTEELEQAQTLPIGYTKGLTRNQAEDVLGDGWNCDTIVHILKGIKYLEGDY